MRRVLERCELRPFLPEDAPSLAEMANDITVWRNLRDLFPHPYTLEHAKGFIAHTLSQEPTPHRAIIVHGLAVGTLGLKLGADLRRARLLAGRSLPRPRHHDRGDPGLHRGGLRDVLAEPHLRPALRAQR